MNNNNDDIVDDVREIMGDLGISNVDDAPYDVLNEIGKDGYVTIDDLTDFADQIYGRE